MAGSAGAYQSSNQDTHSSPKERRLTVSNQIGFSELLQGILGPERKILASEKEMSHFVMRIDELEELF